MNYYERHLGDYARDTGHLSLLEHGAYTLLLDRYYATEEGIPAAQAYRVARARTAPEREAVDAVLSEFFTLTDGVWRQGRVQAAIAEYQEGDEDREAKRENAKERQRRARARRAELFAALRAVGIVPAWDTHTAELERLLSRAPSPPVTPPVTRDDTATQSPLPIHHKEQEQGASPAATPTARKSKEAQGERLPADWTLPSEWADWARSERPDLNPVELAACFADHWHAKPGKDGRKADWLATWRNWVRKERAGPPKPAAAPSGVPRGKPAGPSETPLEAALSHIRFRYSVGQVNEAERDQLIAEATAKHRRNA